MSVDILGTSCDQCRSMVQYSFTSTETRRLVRTDSPGRPPRLSHSSWTMVPAMMVTDFYNYSAIPRSRADSLSSHVILHKWLAFYSAFLNIYRSGVLTALAWLVPHETAAISVQVLCTPYNHAPCHFMQSHIRRVYACLAVTRHLHFWQNDRYLLRATAVTRGWNGYRNESQRRKLTLKKKILPPLLQGFEPATFQSRVRRSNRWAITAPTYWRGPRSQEVGEEGD